MESANILSNYNYSSDDSDFSDSESDSVLNKKQINSDEVELNSDTEDNQLKELGLPISFKGNNKFKWGNGKNALSKKDKGLKHISRLHDNTLNNFDYEKDLIDYDDLKLESKPTQGLKHISIDEYWQTYLDWLFDFNKILYYDTINKEISEINEPSSIFDNNIDEISEITNEKYITNNLTNELKIEPENISDVESFSFEKCIENEIIKVNANECIDESNITDITFHNDDEYDDIDEVDHEDEITEEEMIVSAALKGISSSNKKILFEDDDKEINIEIENAYKAVEETKKDRFESVRPIKKYKPNSSDLSLIKTKFDPYIVKEKIIDDVFDTTRLHMLSDENSRALEAEELSRMSNALRDPLKFKPKLHIAFEDDEEVILFKNDKIIDNMDLLYSKSDSVVDENSDSNIQSDVDSNAKEQYEEELSEEEFNKINIFIKNVKKRIHKYWYQRYLLFDLFDHGILMDEIGWYSATPVRIARHIAQRVKGKVVIDAFCGIGGNAISFAHYCTRVICIEIDPLRLELCKHNAKIYGVDNKMDFILGDYAEISKNLKGDVVFLGPPWGGPKYSEQEVFDINHFKGEELFEISAKITRDIIYCLPKNVNQSQIIKLGSGICEIEKNIHNNRVKCVTAYFGSLVTIA